MKRIIGLDLGTNSIGWSVIDDDTHKIIDAGSRIIPMDAGSMGDYDNGKLKSQASVRTGFRGVRRMYERSALRRERLLRVLNVLGFLPEHYSRQIDFDRHPGQFINHSEPLLPYKLAADNKHTFVFDQSFQEMVAEFAKNHPEMVADGRKIPHDWTIYYLRHKALTQAISKEELAWIILNFNTKRGYYQRDEKDESTANKLEEYKVLTVVDVQRDEESRKSGGLYSYKITYDNGCVKQRMAVAQPCKVGDKMECIVTTALDKDGNIKKDKSGEKKISIRLPKEDDWTLLKKRTEQSIEESGLTVGSYIYGNLLDNPDGKIRGRLVHTIERKYYREELRRILDKQKEFIPELRDKGLYEKCVRELYRSNDDHARSIMMNDFTYLFVNDIIFYHRPLKSKKGEISDCPYEERTYINKDTGEIKHRPIKCLSKSHPLFQAFRTWKFLQNLKIYRREDNVDGKLIIDNDVTAEYITDVAELYDKVSGMKEIKQNQLLKLFRLSDKQYRWNYVEDKTYPLNETRYEINSRLAKIGAGFFLSEESEETLWHILYSINNREELHAALRTFAVKLERTSLAKDFFGGKTDDEKVVFADSFADTFCKMKQFKSSYASYSRKAIRRMLSLMMSGSHWSEDDIDAKTKANIEKILNHDFTAPLDRLPEKVIAELGSKHCMADFQGLPEYLACYVIYGRHSEATDMSIFESVEDVDRYLKFEFRKTNLRNPVVQGVLEEATKVVRDIWAQYGKPDEIHIEMGRELKLPNDKRAAVTQRALDNEHTNLRIKKLLMEFAKPEYDIDSVRPYSPMQQDILKIYESTVLQEQAKTIPDDVKSVVDNLGNPSKKVTSSEIMRYKLWLEQKYRSPYTGEPIQLSRLFTPEYEIEHVIPRSRFFDDSFNNKVICEAAVNKEKSNMLGMEFINKCHGQLVRCGAKTVRIFSVDQYQTFVKEHYSGNKSKQEHLLADDIPDKFISRQLNDTRYISRYALELFSKFVREEGEEEATSKHVVSMVGSITDRLKKEWGINDVWNELVAPRFERMNRLLNTNAFGAWRSENGKQFFQTNIPVEYAQGFSKKRIDHRHHAMDAIVIACATHKHINYFNNENAKSKQFRHDLRNALCTKSAVDDKGNYVWTFNKPWDSFTQDVRNVLQGIIVSFKQNLRIINTTSNYYCHYVNGKKVMDRQEKGDNIAIRKSMHKATVFGKVFLRETKAVKLADALDNVSAITDKAKRKVILDVIASYHNHADKKTLVRYFKDREYKVNGMDFKKVEISFIPKESDKYAVRVRLSDSLFAKRSDIEKNLTDDSIKRILYRHLDKYMVDGEDNIKEALSPNGIEDMNRNIKELNGGKDHKPIYSVRKFEQSDAKFPIGFVGSKDKKFVEAEKGTNLFFAIYKDENGDRSFMTIALHEAIERQKQQLPIAKQEYDDAKHHYTLLFTLSPNDLVYVPQSVDEHVAIDNINGAGQIYKMVSSNKAECYFVSSTFASPILNKVEVSPLNKSEKPWHSVPLRNYGELRDGAIEIAASDMYNTAIKKTCYKLSVDRLGHIKNIIG